VVTAAETPAVDLQAHAMKGGAANVGAIRVAEVARELELLAKSGSLTGAEDLVAHLRREIEALEAVAPMIDWASLA
jgi:HPt (histidine-containing phosphotransfer) domain-containing protein